MAEPCVQIAHAASMVDIEDLEQRIEAQGEELEYLIHRSIDQDEDIMMIRDELARIENSVDGEPISAEQNET